ncbi:Hypothetical_protein [Hexamita inflata]|uniref:Hypothetical_protein n=1 Tax=Hexamita inflata TaxID=28002 RepID=A0AA86RM00_9EUKA|nr:Hypothetical protein HINF_LOCUS64676 [Hexamita inflata]
MYCRLFIAKPNRKYAETEIQGIFNFRHVTPGVSIQDPSTQEILWMQEFPPADPMEFTCKQDIVFFDGCEECYGIQFSELKDALIFQKSMTFYYKFLTKKELKGDNTMIQQAQSQNINQSYDSEEPSQTESEQYQLEPSKTKKGMFKRK